jgi:hypothetical protein
MDNRVVRPGLRTLVAIAYAPPADGPRPRRTWHPPGAAHDAVYVALFLVLGLGLLVLNLLPS